MVLITGNPETYVLIKKNIWAWVCRRTSMSWSRRDFAVMLPTLVASLRLSVDEQSRLPSEVYIFQDLPVRESDRLDSRPIVAGKTVDGCRVHESAPAPNREPHPPPPQCRGDFPHVGRNAGGDHQRKILAHLSGISCIHRIGRRARSPQPGETLARYYVVELGPQS